MGWSMAGCRMALSVMGVLHQQSAQGLHALLNSRGRAPRRQPRGGQVARHEQLHPRSDGRGGSIDGQQQGGARGQRFLAGPAAQLWVEAAQLALGGAVPTSPAHAGVLPQQGASRSSVKELLSRHLQQLLLQGIRLPGPQSSSVGQPSRSPRRDHGRLIRLVLHAPAEPRARQPHGAARSAAASHRDV